MAQYGLVFYICSAVPFGRCKEGPLTTPHRFALIGPVGYIAAGAVVTKRFPDYALLVGTPAGRDGGMSQHGARLEGSGEDGILLCPCFGQKYRPGVVTVRIPFTVCNV